MRRLWIGLVTALSIALGGAPKEVVGAGEAVYNLWRFAYGELRIICTGTAVQTPVGVRFLTAGHCAEEEGARYYISRAVDPDQLVRVRLKGPSLSGPGGITPSSSFPRAGRGRPCPCARGLPRWGRTSGPGQGSGGAADPALRHVLGTLALPGRPGGRGRGRGHALRADQRGRRILGLRSAPPRGGKVCVWGIWVGGFVPRVKLDGALGVDLPAFWY